MHNYSSRTLVGNWTEDRLSPDFGGLKPASQTENQIRSLEATRKAIPPYGAHLLEHVKRRVVDAPGATLSATTAAAAMRDSGSVSSLASSGGGDRSVSGAGAAPSPTSSSTRKPTGSGIKFDRIEDRFDYANLINPDRLYPPSTWASITASAHFTSGGDVGGEFGSQYAMADTALTKDPAAMAAYRARWIHESDAHNRSGRFTTEMVRALAGTVSEAYVPRGDRVLPGTSKAVETLREKALERHGSDGVWMICKALPERFTLAQLRKAIEGLQLELSVDQWKDIWHFLDPLEAGKVRRETALEALLGADGGTMSARRRDAVETVWALLRRIQAGTTGSGSTMGTTGTTMLLGGAGEEAVPVLTLLAHYDPSPANHPDVKSRVVSNAEVAKKRLRECLAYVIAGEPPAPPVVVYMRASAAAAAADGASAGSPFTSPRTSTDISGALASGRSGSIGSARSTSIGGGGGGLYSARTSGTSTFGLSPTMMLSRTAFFRGHELISAGFDSDAAFVGMLVACWHLGEAEYTLASAAAGGDGFVLPDSIRPVLEAAVRERKGFPVPPALHMAAATASTVTGPVPEAAFATSLRAGTLARSASLSATTGATAASSTAAAGSGVAASTAASGAAAPGPAFGRGLPASNITLLVTHTDGRKSIQKVPADRFLRRDDPADLRARLAAQGVTDVATISTDF